MKLSIVKDLTPFREAAKTRIDRKAVRLRETFYTPGMESIYAEKVREAEEFTWFVMEHGREPTPDPDSFLAGEVSRTGMAPAQVAELWLTMAAESKRLLQALETVRLETKRQIDGAGSPAEIEQIESAAPWPV